jgi:hypothetical protein
MNSTSIKYVRTAIIDRWETRRDFLAGFYEEHVVGEESKEFQSETEARTTKLPDEVKLIKIDRVTTIVETI